MIFKKSNKAQPLRERTAVVNNSNSSPTIIFIHGLSGSALSTWGPMLTVCASDRAFDRFNLQTFEFPSVKWRLPFTTRMAKLQELAKGLRTVIETDHSGCQEIILVGHSLGGLVARQYIVDELRAGRTLKIKNLLMYATPNTGATLGNIGSSLSWRHFHLRQLCNNSDILERLNDDWERRRVEDLLPVLYVLGSADAVVKPESALPYIGRDNSRTLVGCGHISITQAKNTDDMRFKILKSAVLGQASENTDKVRSDTTENTIEGHIKPNPLFDIYDQVDKPYYLVRKIDEELELYNSSFNVWLSGPSGAGKTAVLRRIAFENNWNLYYISLGGVKSISHQSILRAICAQVAELQGNENSIEKDTSILILIGFLRKAVKSSTDDRGFYILIEEFSISKPEDYLSILDVLSFIANAIASDPAIRGRVRIAISSIPDPEPYIHDQISKIRERFIFSHLSYWDNNDVTRLIKMLCGVFDIKFSQQEMQSIIEHARGSPRYIKLLFRRLAFNSQTAIPLQDLLQRVSRENVVK